MNAKSIENQFARMGVRFRLVRPEQVPARRRRMEYALDIVSGRGGQSFELQIGAERETGCELQVLQCVPKDRHLLLLVKTPQAKDRFLCGHDEREWFVAAVPGGASSVVQAKLALQPAGAQLAAARAGLSLRQRTCRHNQAFIRQGEWFFVPAPALRVDKKLILRGEPISRGGGKPHLVAELYRSGGEPVYVCPRYPNGLDRTAYRQLLARDENAARWNWQRRVRDATVYARGTVRHRDHATITLREWHQVSMNTENTTRQMANVAFLD